jgi:protein SCO1/2
VKLSKKHVLRAMWGRFFAVLLGFAAMAGPLSGCHRGQNSGSSAAEKRYSVRGAIVSTDADKGEVLLKHEAIAGFMEAMTMSYKLKDPAIISELHPGDVITATLETQQGSDGPVNMRLDHIVVIAQARPDTKPAVMYHVPAPGDSVPDFPLLNQSGRKIRLSQFRGKVVLLTFIYTRCTVADYCPKMSRNFAEIDKALAANPAVYAKTHLLSISFDPEYDTPKVLRSYGGAYTGKYTNETFGHWDFAAPSVADLLKVEQFFDLGVTPGDTGSLMHSLATLVIGKDGKVVAFYPTNDWTPDTLLAQIRTAAA